MPKSKYPKKLDSSAEIPAVRDNITEIGSDVINSLRSAIFKIESTLGINPQGSADNTVAQRISRALDENGNIKSEALAVANVLSGPIIDANVSSVASIKESKLKLDYPTNLLQSQISILNNEISGLLSALEELSYTISYHIEKSALNRHNAISINVEDAVLNPSDIASLSIESNNLQAVIEEIYNAHINFSGASISSINNSHNASQIYYDNDLTSSTIFSNSVQGAIDDIANAESISFRNNFLNLSSNGRIRSGSISDDFEDPDYNSILVDSIGATYTRADGGSTTTFTITGTVIPNDTISRFDSLLLSGSSIEEDNKTYKVKSHTLDGSGNLQTVEVYGGPKGVSNSGLIVKIIKNQYSAYNPAGFASTVRPRSNKTNTPDIVYLNPDCATIISSGIIPENITSSNHTFDIVIDGGSAITIDTYNSTVTSQSLDSIVSKINEQAVDLHLNFLAYKVRSSGCYELAIAHNMPNISGDYTNRTIEIRVGSSDDGTTSLGFSSILDTEFEGSSGNSLALNGLILSGFGLINEFTNSTIEIVPSTRTLSLLSDNFKDYGVRVGDTVVVSGSTSSLDDGSFRVANISGNILEIDLSGFTFSGQLDDSSRIYIIRNSAHIGELTFEEIGTVDGTILFDVFMTEEKDIFHSKRIEVEGSLLSGPFVATISDVSRNFIISGQTATINVNSSGLATLIDPNLQAGEPVFIASTGVYRLFSNDGLSFVTVKVNASGPPLISQSVVLYGFDEISQDNYLLCRGGFSTSLGRVLGDSLGSGIPALMDKRSSGTADNSIISESFIEKYIEGPRNELRSSGIIRGCRVVDVTYTDTGSEIYQTFSVTPGIAVVNGIRYEFRGAENIRVDNGDSYIVGIDSYGCIISDNYVSNPSDLSREISPFFNREVAYLAEVNNDGVSIASTIDLRLFVDNIDYKFLNEVTVSNNSAFGHFTSISDAVSYTRRISKMFSSLEPFSIYIGSGTYEVDETIIVDFDLTIRGSGPATVIKKGSSLVTGTVLVGSNVDLSTSIFMIGGGSNINSDDILYGVTFRDFTVKSDEAVHVGSVFSISQPIEKLSSEASIYATYRFENINFIGPKNINGSAIDPNKVGEFAIVVGQQDPGTLIPEVGIVMGNIMVNNCRFDKMGLEKGAIKFLETSGTIRDVIVTGNIVTNGSPNLAYTLSEVVEYPTTVTIENLIESNNSFRIKI